MKGQMDRICTFCFLIPRITTRFCDEKHLLYVAISGRPPLKTPSDHYRGPSGIQGVVEPQVKAGGRASTLHEYHPSAVYREVGQKRANTASWSYCTHRQQACETRATSSSDFS